MQASQTINLNEKISEQRTGIVLHWQAYVNGSAQNYDHNYCYVPKSHSYSGGVSMFMTSQNATHVANKYVYINEQSIRGNDLNYSDDQQSGITLERRYFVLTEVLGV